MSEKIRVGIIGTRGIPNNYGGFERFVELLIKEHDTTSNINFIIYGEKNQIDKYEDYTIRKIADLIYVKHSDFIKAKHE